MRTREFRHQMEWLESRFLLAEGHALAILAVGNNGRGVTSFAPAATIGSLKIMGNTGTLTSTELGDALRWNTTWKISAEQSYPERSILTDSCARPTLPTRMDAVLPWDGDQT